MNCGICGSDDAAEIEVLRAYSAGPVHVCKGCGTVYVRDRRSSEQVANDWSLNLFGSHFYTAAKPYMKARHVFVAESLHQGNILARQSVCDIGAGEGYFLEIAREYGAHVFGVEPSLANCARMLARDIPCHCGTAEGFSTDQQFDVVTMLWTLENCADIRGVVQSAKRLLKPGGKFVVATGSRIMVPFKKSLADYIDRVTPADTNPYRLSANTLQALFAHNGLRTTWLNHYRDSDVLMGVAEIGEQITPKDDWREVIRFFEQWDKATVENGWGCPGSPYDWSEAA